MALFNKIVTTLVLLVLIPVITVGLIVPHEAVQLLLDFFEQLDGQLDPSVSTVQLLVRVILALLINAVLVILLYLEIRRPADYGLRVKQVESGDAQVAVESVVDQLKYHIDGMPGVLDVQPTIKSRRGGVELTLLVEMAADLDLPANIEEITEVARRVVEEDMGLQLRGRPKLNLRTVPFPEPAPQPDLDVGIGVDENEAVTAGETTEPEPRISEASLFIDDTPEDEPVEPAADDAG